MINTEGSGVTIAIQPASDDEQLVEEAAPTTPSSSVMEVSNAGEETQYGPVEENMSCALVDENNNLATPGDSKEELPQVDEIDLVVKDDDPEQEQDQEQDEDAPVKIHEMTSKQVLEEEIELDVNGSFTLPPNIVIPEIKIDLVDDNGDPLREKRADSSR